MTMLAFVSLGMLLAIMQVNNNLLLKETKVKNERNLGKIKITEKKIKELNYAKNIYFKIYNKVPSNIKELKDKNLLRKNFNNNKIILSNGIISYTGTNKILNKYIKQKTDKKLITDNYLNKTKYLYNNTLIFDNNKIQSNNFKNLNEMNDNFFHHMINHNSNIMENHINNMGSNIMENHINNMGSNIMENHINNMRSNIMENHINNNNNFFNNMLIEANKLDKNMIY